MKYLLFKIIFLVCLSIPGLAMDDCYGKDENGQDLWVMSSSVGFGENDDQLVRLNNGERVVPCSLRKVFSRTQSARWQGTYLDKFDSDFVALVDKKIREESSSANVYECIRDKQWEEANPLSKRQNLGYRQLSHKVSRKCAQRSLRKLLRIVLSASYKIYGVEIKNIVVGKSSYEDLHSDAVPDSLVNELEDPNSRDAFFVSLRVSFEKIFDFMVYEGDLRIGQQAYKVHVSPFIEAPKIKADVLSLDLTDTTIEFGLVSEVVREDGETELEIVFKVEPNINREYRVGLAATKVCRIFDTINFWCELDLGFGNKDGEKGFAVFFRGHIPF